MAQYFRTDQTLIHVGITGVTLSNEIVWEMMEGGDPVAEETVVFPGGMGDQVALGGLPKWSPLVIEGLWSETFMARYRELTEAVGSATTEAHFIQLGANKVPIPGGTISYTGVLTGAERPKYKSSESTDAYLKLTMGVNGKVG